MRRQRGCEFGGPASGILTCNNELHVRIKYLRSLPSHDNRAPSSRSREPSPLARFGEARRLGLIGEQISVDRAPPAITESRWRTR